MRAPAVAVVRVVPSLDEIEHRHAGLDLGLEPAAVEQLAFERGEETLPHGIVETIIHRAPSTAALRPRGNVCRRRVRCTSSGERGAGGRWAPAASDKGQREWRGLPDPPPRPDKIISHRFDNLIRCLFGKATGG